MGSLLEFSEFLYEQVSGTLGMTKKAMQVLVLQRLLRQLHLLQEAGIAFSTYPLEKDEDATSVSKVDQWEK